ncbi:hypothetical protein BX666DRAFT_2103654 [Dichotomocladium elegans]|nr:hypothetical protein BX666DRAFT_2103654 [Dichotomocladium elegans]
MGTSADPFPTPNMTSKPENANTSSVDHNVQSSSSATPAKWLQGKDAGGEETDQVGLVAHNRGYKLNNWGPSESQFGGNKLRAPRTLAHQEEYIQGNKKRMVVKRRRRNLDDELSDVADDDPYRQINIEDILSPIEVPTDIVQRPALKRIIKSPQIEGLARTAMEFIESEKNFSKILSRLSAILHHDDPQYLDLEFERTPEQRRKRKAMSAMDATEGSEGKKLDGEEKGKDTDRADAAMSENNKKDEAAAETMSEPKKEDVEMEDDLGPDTEAIEVVRSVRELLLENINFSNEYLSRLQSARDKLTKAHMQKEALYNQLKANAANLQGRRNTRHN